MERSLNPENTLRIVRCLLSESGKLLLGTDNRLGIRYFCGDRDAFTDRNFDSLENYVRINMWDRQQLEGSAYARAELVQMLENAGFQQHKFYAVPVDFAVQAVLHKIYVANFLQLAPHSIWLPCPGATSSSSTINLCSQ